jgi:hypothetical protein
MGSALPKDEVSGARAGDTVSVTLERQMAEDLLFALSQALGLYGGKKKDGKGQNGKGKNGTV